ncbi:MAG: AarF/ABC1/UbiB kinase family protein [Bdellovibrionota bacterium]
MDDSKKSGEPPKSLFSRSKDLVGLLAKMGQKEVASRISSLVSENPSLKKINTQLEQAHVLVDALKHLRGAAMKAGQMLSLEARDFLPPEVIDILNQLQDQSESMRSSLVAEILLKELGPEILGEIRDLSENPVASASIGQVHRAQFRGQDVAIKVQFPGVAESIVSDLFMLRKLAETFLKVTGKDIRLEALFCELSEILKQEVDYISEATHMEEYAKMLEGRPGFVVPRPICELVNARVLGMSFEGGVKPDDWIRSNPSIEDRVAVARKILDLYVIEFFENGFVQTDPNFGNFFIRPESGDLVVLDFGAMKRYHPSFIKNYKELLRLIRSAPDAKIIEHTLAMKLMDPRESQECRDAFVAMLKMSLEPFGSGGEAFDFGSTAYSSDMRKSSLHFTKLIRYSSPPHQILFLHRKLSGVFRLLQTMQVKIPLEDYWENFVSV